MSLSHYSICLASGDVEPGDVLLSWVDSAGVPNTAQCGPSHSVFLRSYSPVVDNFESFQDGMILGAGVMAAMAVAWVIQFLRRAL